MRCRECGLVICETEEQSRKPACPVTPPMRRLQYLDRITNLKIYRMHAGNQNRGWIENPEWSQTAGELSLPAQPPVLSSATSSTALPLAIERILQCPRKA